MMMFGRFSSQLDRILQFVQTFGSQRRSTLYALGKARGNDVKATLLQVELVTIDQLIVGNEFFLVLIQYTRTDLDVTVFLGHDVVNAQNALLFGRNAKLGKQELLQGLHVGSSIHKGLE